MTGRGDDEGEPTAPDPDAEDDSGGEGVFGPFDEARPIEPGDPALEHVLFVLLGVLSGIAATLELLGIF